MENEASSQPIMLNSSELTIILSVLSSLTMSMLDSLEYFDSAAFVSTSSEEYIHKLAI